MISIGHLDTYVEKKRKKSIKNSQQSPLLSQKGSHSRQAYQSSKIMGSLKSIKESKSTISNKRKGSNLSNIISEDIISKNKNSVSKSSESEIDTYELPSSNIEARIKKKGINFNSLHFGQSL